MRPVVVHPRMDFMLYCFDPIINQAANWHYMSGGISPVPVVFWGIVNRGGEQAAQHSQALHSMFCHVPGLKVVAPSCPADAKGLMLAAIFDDNPVVFIDDRWLYGATEPVREDAYRTPIGKGLIRRTGKDVTLIAWSGMVPVALEAAALAEHDGVSCTRRRPEDAEAVRPGVGRVERRRDGPGRRVRRRVEERGMGRRNRGHHRRGRRPAEGGSAPRGVAGRASRGGTDARVGLLPDSREHPRRHPFDGPSLEPISPDLRP